MTRLTACGRAPSGKKRMRQGARAGISLCVPTPSLTRTNDVSTLRLPRLTGGKKASGEGKKASGHEGGTTMKKCTFFIAFLAGISLLACGGSADPAPRSRVESESKPQGVAALPGGAVFSVSPDPTPPDWGWELGVSCALEGLSECSSQCVCTLTDSHNCGGCGNECNPDGSATLVCDHGMCQDPTAPGASECSICLMQFSNDASRCPMCLKCALH
jgi:hypothetical protein